MTRNFGTRGFLPDLLLSPEGLADLEGLLAIPAKPSGPLEDYVIQEDSPFYPTLFLEQGKG